MNIAAIVKDCASFPKSGDGGNCAIITTQSLPDAVIKSGALIADVSPAYPSYRASRSIISAANKPQPRSLPDFLALEEIRRLDPPVIILNHAENLWLGLTGRRLRLAQSELRYLANVSKLKFILIGAAPLWDGIRTNAQLLWRFDLHN